MCCAPFHHCRTHFCDTVLFRSRTATHKGAMIMVMVMVMMTNAMATTITMRRDDMGTRERTLRWLDGFCLRHAACIRTHRTVALMNSSRFSHFSPLASSVGGSCGFAQPIASLILHDSFRRFRRVCTDNTSPYARMRTFFSFAPFIQCTCIGSRCLSDSVCISENIPIAHHVSPPCS